MRQSNMRRSGATVYILRSVRNPTQRYIGYTTLRLTDRLRAHNAHRVPHTAKYAPWEVELALWLSDETKARTPSSATSRQAAVARSQRGTSNGTITGPGKPESPTDVG
jgi:putative endonuclease